MFTLVCLTFFNISDSTPEHVVWLGGSVRALGWILGALGDWCQGGDQEDTMFEEPEAGWGAGGSALAWGARLLLDRNLVMMLLLISSVGIYVVTRKT